MLPSDEPILTVLLCGAIAAVVAGLGAVPFARSGGVPRVVLGAAYALASGFMLAASYLLMEEGIKGAPLTVIAGAIVGTGYSFWSQRFAGIEGAGLSPELIGSELGGYKILLQNALHAASEGLAIGAAMAVSLPLGIYVAGALALHNVAEGMALSAALRTRGMKRGDAAAMCVITNVPQPLMAVVAFALVAAAPWLLPPILGVAAGSLLYLVMTELLPSSYVRAGNTRVALVVSTSAALVVLLRRFLE